MEGERSKQILSKIELVDSFNETIRSIPKKLRFQIPAFQQSKNPEECTLDEFLHEICNPKGFVKDVVKIFLLTYTKIIKPHEFFSSLFNQYYKTSDKETKSRITTVFALWMRIRLDDFKDLRITLLFGSMYTILRTSGDKEEGESAQEFMKTMSTLQKLRQVDLPIAIPKKDFSKVGELKYHESLVVELSDAFMASQLVIVDFEKFSKYKFYHFIQEDWEKDQHNPLSQLREDMKNIAFIICNEILKFKEPKKRALVISKLLKICQCCLRLGDLNAVWKLLMGLTMFPVARLDHTWELLSEEELVNFKELCSLFIPDKDGEYSFYEKYTPAKKSPFIPCFLIKLEQIRRLDVGGYIRKGRLHYSKLQALAKILDDIRVFSQICYTIEKDYKGMQFWQNVPEVSFQKLLEISFSLEPSENTDDIVNQPWWQGEISKLESVEKMLSECSYNAFVLWEESGSRQIYASLKRLGSTHTITLRIKRTSITCKSKNRNTIKGLGFNIEGSTHFYTTLSSLVENCRELHSFRPAWKKEAKEHKKKIAKLSNVEARIRSVYRWGISLSFRQILHTQIGNKFDFSRSHELTPIPDNIMKTINSAIKHKDITKLVSQLKEIAPNALFPEGKNLIWLATALNLPTMIDHIIYCEGPIPDVNSRDETGWTALHFACNKGPDRFNVIKNLAYLGANVNIASKQGETPLHCVVQHIIDNIEDNKVLLDILRLFVKVGAKVQVQNEKGQTPLHLAIAVGNSDCVRFLLENGADRFTPDNQGMTPMQQLNLYHSPSVLEIKKVFNTVSPNEKAEQNLSTGLSAGSYFANFIQGKVCQSSVDGPILISICEDTEAKITHVLLRTKLMDAFFDVIRFSKPEDLIETLRNLSGDEFTVRKDEKTLSAEENVHKELENASFDERESIFMELFPKRRSMKGGVRFA